MDIDYKELLQEIATFENAGIASFLDILPDPDIVLLKRGEDGRVLDDIASDEQVTQCMINRKYRVLLNERYAFKPGVAGGGQVDARGKLAHKMFLEDLENTVIYNVFSSLLDAPFYGYSVLEIIWEARDGFYRIKDIIPRPHEWFAFNDDGRLIFRGDTNYAGVTVPKSKFIISRHFPTFKNPYGLRLLSRCLWPVAFKKGGVRFLARFLEKFGMPWVIANAPDGATAEQKAEMARNLFSMVQDAVGVIPKGATVQLHSATTNQADIFEVYIDRWDKAISKVLMGQTLTADIGDGGSFAASKTHKDVGDDMAAADRLMITSSMNELAWIYTQVNFGDIPAPTFSYIDDEDLTARADLDKKLYDMGVSFNAEYVEQIYGIDKKYFTVREPQQFPVPAFASVSKDEDATVVTDNQNTLDSAAQTSASLLAEKANISLKVLEKTIKGAESIEELEDALIDLKLDPTEISNILKNVLTNASLFGIISSNSGGRK